MCRNSAQPPFIRRRDSLILGRYPRAFVLYTKIFTRTLLNGVACGWLPCQALMLPAVLSAFLLLELQDGWADEQVIPAEEAAQNAQDGEVENRTLLPTLGRQWLSEHGVGLTVLAVNDWWANVRGGNYRGVGTMGNLNAILTIDTKKAGWWEDGSFTFYGIWVYGSRPSNAVGDYQFTSSIDGPIQLEPYEAFYEHTFLDGRLKWLAGIHDLTLDFGILNYGLTFINSSFFTPSTMTQLPYSFYPNTSFGTRAVYQITDRTYSILGFYDGKPIGDAGIHTIDLQVSEQDGLYSILELGSKGSSPAGYYSKYAFGVWHCSGEFTDVAGDSNNSNFGTYLLGEQELWKEQEAGDQGFGAFAQVGQAQQDRNLNPWYFGGGVRYKGLVPGRDNDVLGFGLAMATFGATARAGVPGIESSERTFELSYRAPINSWLTVTPDAQFVIDPSGNPNLENDLILYLRTEVGL